MAHLLASPKHIPKGETMKKIVIFGGGSGLSQILKGLKLFPAS